MSTLAVTKNGFKCDAKTFKSRLNFGQIVEPAPTLFVKHSSGKLNCKTVDAGKT